MNATRTPHRPPSGHRRGTAAVEFALTAPILFLFLFAALEFGRYNMLMQTANNAAFEAARACCVAGASAADGKTAAQDILKAVGIRGSSVAISPSAISYTTAEVTATVTIPVSSNLWTSQVFLKDSTITQHCTLTRDWMNSAH